VFWRRMGNTTTTDTNENTMEGNILEVDTNEYPAFTEKEFRLGPIAPENMSSERNYVNLPNSDGFNTGKLAFTLDHVLSDEECERLIEATETRGYTKALVNIGGNGKQMCNTKVRDSSRCIVDDALFAQDLLDRIKKFIPSEFRDTEIVGLNERLRFLRYDPGQKFAGHCDGTYVRKNGDFSQLTIQLYFNGGFEGGATTFIDKEEKGNVPCIPRAGMVLVFQQNIIHEGSKVIQGRKYNMRTEILYRRKPKQEKLQD